MVDRYRSILEESKLEKSKSSLILESDPHRYDKLVQKTDSSSKKMRECIRKYREATTAEQEKQIQRDFRREQAYFREARDRLAQQYQLIEKDPLNKNEAMFVKEQLLKTVQQELGLDVKMNEIMSQRSRQMKLLTDQLQPGTQRIQNALNDLKAKRDQIMYLEEQVQECVQLLEVVGILVLEQGEKIDLAREKIEVANVEVEKALGKIEKAKKRQQSSQKRKCCIIILGLAVICLIVVFVLGVKLNYL